MSKHNLSSDSPPMSKPIQFLAGDRIRIKPEWQDEGDDQFEWRAVEDEAGGRVLIAPIDPSLSFVPRQLVDVEMLEPKDFRAAAKQSLPAPKQTLPPLLK